MLSDEEKIVLKDIIDHYGNNLGEGDYSFFKDLSTVQSSIMLKALIQAEIYPFSMLLNKKVSINFYRDIPFLMRDKNDMFFAANCATDEGVRQALGEVARFMGFNVYTCELKSGLNHLVISLGDEKNIRKFIKGTLNIPIDAKDIKVWEGEMLDGQ